MTRRVLTALLGVLLLGPLSAGERERVVVSVAASLLPAVETIARSYEQTHEAVEIAVNGAASGVLLQQVLRGAPVDLLVSASPAELDRLESAGLVVPGTRRELASNRLVVLVPIGAVVPATVAELIEPRFGRIAVGNPRTAPVGRYTEQALAALGLARPLAERLVPGESARQLIDYVARDEVDAAITYRTDAELHRDRVGLGPALPAETHEPIRYVAALVGAAPASAAARDFLDALTSAGSREILRQRGFLPPARSAS